MTDGNEDFAAFEAAAQSDEPPVVAEDEAKTPEGDEAPEGDEPNPETNDEGEEKAEKRRSKPANERIAEITRARREAERERDELRQRITALESGKQPEPVATNVPTGLTEPDPNDASKYEFGEADPKYIADLARYEVRKELAEERAALQQQHQQAEFTRQVTQLDTNWQEQSGKASEKYDDFAETIADYQENEPCPAILAMAIQSSDVGADAAYYLAKNPAENRKLAQLAKTNPLEAARLFGRIEARFAEAPKPKGRTVTEAPEPPSHRARGAGGKFEVDAATTDFAAFERKANGR